MPKTRTECAQQVRTAFLQTERAADVTATAASQCVATLIEARAKGRFPTTAGTDELALISEGLTHALAARACFLKAHPGLAELSTRFDLPLAFGPDDCPPERQAPTGELRLVG